MELFSKKDYDTIYDNIGRHLGSYSTLLELMNESKMTLKEVLEELKTFAIIHLRSCVKQSSNITKAFSSLKKIIEKILLKLIQMIQ